MSRNKTRLNKRTKIQNKPKSQSEQQSEVQSSQVHEALSLRHDLKMPHIYAFLEHHAGYEVGSICGFKNGRYKFTFGTKKLQTDCQQLHERVKQHGDSYGIKVKKSKLTSYRYVELVLEDDFYQHVIEHHNGQE